jgi:hypothetical protein
MGVSHTSANWKVSGEQRLHRNAGDYERVVLWMEHDSWDQLVLGRLLAHYANGKRPRVLELIAADEFPGSQRYIGLGQLPSEALRLLWPSRKPVTPAQLNAWNVLASDDPQPLATIARSGTPALPIMASALHRHLRELPSVENVLRLTQHLVLQILSEGGTFTLNRVWHLLQTEREPRAHFFSSSASPTSAAPFFAASATGTHCGLHRDR